MLETNAQHRPVAAVAYSMAFDGCGEYAKISRCVNGFEVVQPVLSSRRLPQRVWPDDFVRSWVGRDGTVYESGRIREDRRNRNSAGRSEVLVRTV